MIVSGILEHEWADTEGLLAAAGFLLERVDADGEWRSGLFAKRPA